jgi:hypothetical protein
MDDGFPVEHAPKKDAASAKANAAKPLFIGAPELR